MVARKPKKRSRRSRPKTRGNVTPDERARHLKRMRAWIPRIRSELGDLLRRHEIFCSLRDIFNTNPETRDPPLLVDWMVQNHVEAVSVGVRRLCDHGSNRFEVESLGRLLWELLEHPGNYHVGGGKPAFTRRTIRSDLRQLEDAAARIERFVNKRVAHAAPRKEFRRFPTYGQLGKALDELDRIATRYALLLTGDERRTCKRVIQTNWKRVLWQAWLDDPRHPL